jgi:hypothetical protein
MQQVWMAGRGWGGDAWAGPGEKRKTGLAQENSAIFYSPKFSTESKLIQPKDGFPFLAKFQIKYGFVGN